MQQLRVQTRSLTRVKVIGIRDWDCISYVCACMHACVHACVHVCVSVCLCVYFISLSLMILY